MFILLENNFRKIPVLRRYMNILFELNNSTLYKNKLFKNTVRSETEFCINTKQSGSL